MSTPSPHPRLRLLPILAVCFICLGATSKSCKILQEGTSSLSFNTELQVLTTAGQVSDTFNEDEPVRMVLSVTNEGEEAVELRFDSSRVHDFVIFDNDEDVVHWASNDETETEGETIVRFEPGQTRTYTYDWTHTGTEEGVYSARGAFLFEFEEFDADPLTSGQFASNVVSFTIE